jgi:type I restriction enzyme S subunit
LSWPKVKLGEIFDITSSKRVHEKDWRNEGVPFYRAREVAVLSREGQVDNDLFIDESMYEEFKAKYGAPEAGDLLVTAVGTLGKVYAVKKSDRFYFKDASVIWLRARQEVDTSYIRHAMNSTDVQRFIQNSSGATVGTYTISRANATEIPLPPLPEQKRIAAILDKADAIRRKRQQAIQLVDDFLRAVFLDMFGDPVTNPKGWKTACLEELVKVVSGATPSKSNDAYWVGEFPWVSPKDMKSVEIGSSIDHVNQVVFERENLKKLPVGSVLIVVRGMILAHTVPVGITTTEVAINQDIKAFVSSGRVLPEFLLWFLLSQHANLLSKVTTAAHGTKRFDMVDLLGLPVFVPDIGAQRKFVSIVGSYKETLAELDWSHKNALQIFNSLSQKAFSGQL